MTDTPPRPPEGADRAAHAPDRSPPPATASGPPRTDAGRALGRSAAWARIGLLTLGGLACVRDLLPMLSLPEVELSVPYRFRAELGALTHLVSYALAAWLAGKLLEALGHALDLLAFQAEAAGKLARSLEGARPGDASRAIETAAEPPPGRDIALAEIRLAIESARWGHAEALCRALLDDRPDDPEGLRLAEQLDEARGTAVEGLKARLEAARKILDGELALDVRDALAQVVRGEPLHEVDRELAHWLMDLIQKRLRSGTMGADVAVIAGRMVESLEATPEAASLRAALPTLRRSAGLCPRCAEPYKGIADACPKCLAAVSFPIFGAGAPEVAEAGPAGDEDGEAADDEYFASAEP